MPADIEVAIRSRPRVGEGPYWTADGRLGWVDILGQVLHERAIDGTVTEVGVPSILGAAIPRESGGHVLAVAEGYAELSAAGDYRLRLEVLPDGIRMNDAKCDPAGRLWSGSCEMTFAPGLGALRRLDPDWTETVAVEGISQPNGLGWSPDGRSMYLIDSVDRVVHRYPFDVDSPTGIVGDGGVLAGFPDGAGIPDGLCVDADGMLWVAMWGGARLYRLSPDGDIVDTLGMPVAQPSSCAFGGPDGDVLYVTSAREGLDLDDDALDGSVFAVTGTGASAPPGTAFAG